MSLLAIVTVFESGSSIIMDISGSVTDQDDEYTWCLDILYNK